MPAGRDVVMEAVQFLSALFGGYGGDDLRCEIRCLAPGGRKTDAAPPRQWFNLSPKSILAAANSCIAWGRDWDVYCGVLPRTGRQGGTDSVHMAGWLYADIDGGNMGPDGSLELLRRTDLPDPHMIVKSGGGIHVYWRLLETVGLPSAEERYLFKSVLRRIVLRIGGVSPSPHADPSAAEPARILRVPETGNHKTEPPRCVQLIAFDSEAAAYPLSEWSNRLPLLPRPKQSDAPMVVSGMVTEGLKRWAETGYPQGKRHHDLTAAAAWLIRDCKLSKQDAEELLRIKAARSTGLRQITLDEIRSMVQWA